MVVVMRRKDAPAWAHRHTACESWYISIDDVIAKLIKGGHYEIP